MKKARYEIIDNIRRAAEEGRFSSCVEVSDPKLTKDERSEIAKRSFASRTSLSYKIKRFFAERIADAATAMVMGNVEIFGTENLQGIVGGAIITSNHFSPIDSTAARRVVSLLDGGKLNIVTRDSNLAMGGVVGFLMNYARTIPLCEDAHYMARSFAPAISDMLARDEFVLIYPEAEMWQNYRKPRPHMSGAYYYAAKNNAPIIPLFVEMRDTSIFDKDGFLRQEYAIHVLPPIYPDAKLSARENTRMMCERDFSERSSTYERIYGRSYNSGFSEDDIAGFIVAQDPYMSELFATV